MQSVCNYCGIIENNCNIKNDILNILDIYLIQDISDIILNYIQCDFCSNVLHKNMICCDYLCECEEYECSHYVSECYCLDMDRLVCL